MCSHGSPSHGGNAWVLSGSPDNSSKAFFNTPELSQIGSTETVEKRVLVIQPTTYQSNGNYESNVLIQVLLYSSEVIWIKYCLQIPHTCLENERS